LIFLQKPLEILSIHKLNQKKQLTLMKESKIEFLI